MLTLLPQDILFILLPFLSMSEMAHLLVANRKILVSIKTYSKRCEKETRGVWPCLRLKQPYLSYCFYIGLGAFLSHLSLLRGQKINFEDKEINIESVSCHLFSRDRKDKRISTNLVKISNTSKNEIHYCIETRETPSWTVVEDIPWKQEHYSSLIRLQGVECLIHLFISGSCFLDVNLDLYQKKKAEMYMKEKGVSLGTFTLRFIKNKWTFVRQFSVSPCLGFGPYNV